MPGNRLDELDIGPAATRRDTQVCRLRSAARSTQKNFG